MQAHVTPFFHAATSTWSYLVRDPASGEAAVIDPPLDFDLACGEVGHASAAAILQAAGRDGAHVRWVLETHAHADHLSAAHWLAERCGAQTAIGAGIVQVQRTFRQRLGLDEEEPHLDASAFDRLLHDGDELPIGNLSIRVLATPGHTADSVSYLIGDAVFVGDTLFSPGAGSARCDFPGGDAHALYRSVWRIYGLPASRMFLAHDYPSDGAAPRAEVPMDEQRSTNKHIREGVDEAAFVAMRQQRDAGLPPPRLLWPALQVNIRGGRLPPPDNHGRRYFKLPLQWRVE
ncbi:MBL fold metallo-hydrolase [Frateuria hangzhouensis]|uniref:MBL fold metallo-hydrolase n=1 Tax=Frateuria hangzhouensis TaxID=2995589 RepID=UPI002260946E|nr:MBL fold metallo-hydrolase [Frateuria sp. STR12]MCX7515022.1 MBL fold metallo-hydrolase [Frateuria sp. STR12]